MKGSNPFEGLKEFIPENSFEKVMELILHYRVHLTVSQDRRTKLGDFSHKSSHYANHRISINGSLNRYAFLITLIHELAHLVAFETYGKQIAAHGKEWKHTYSAMLKSFVDLNVFPEDLIPALRQTIQRPSATTAGELPLQRALRKYDQPRNLRTVEELPINTLFVIPGGRVFLKGPLVRKRYKCLEIKTKNMYLFQPLYEVKPLQSRPAND